MHLDGHDCHFVSVSVSVFVFEFVLAFVSAFVLYLHIWWMYLDGQGCQWNAHFHHLLSSIKEEGDLRGKMKDERGGWRRKNGYNRCRGKIRREKREMKRLCEMWKWLLRWEYADCLESWIYVLRTACISYRLCIIVRHGGTLHAQIK